MAIRYQKETKFYRCLEQWDSEFDLDQIAQAGSPFEKIVEDSLKNQTRKLKQEWTENRWSLEEEKDELLSWIHEVKTPLTAIYLIIERLDNEAVKSQLSYEWLAYLSLTRSTITSKTNSFYGE